MRAKVQGTVLLECVMLPDGSVGRVDVVKSLDSTFGLDQEAVKAARQWRFRPRHAVRRTGSRARDHRADVHPSLTYRVRLKPDANLQEGQVRLSRTLAHNCAAEVRLKPTCNTPRPFGRDILRRWSRRRASRFPQGQGDVRDVTRQVADAVISLRYALGHCHGVRCRVDGGHDHDRVRGRSNRRSERGVRTAHAARGEYRHHLRWGDDNGSSHVRAAIVGPRSLFLSLTVRWCSAPGSRSCCSSSTRARSREVVVQIFGDNSLAIARAVTAAPSSAAPDSSAPRGPRQRGIPSDRRTCLDRANRRPCIFRAGRNWPACEDRKTSSEICFCFAKVCACSSTILG